MSEEKKPAYVEVKMIECRHCGMRALPHVEVPHAASCPLVAYPHQKAL